VGYLVSAGTPSRKRLGQPLSPSTCISAFSSSPTIPSLSIVRSIATDSPFRHSLEARLCCRRRTRAPGNRPWRLRTEPILISRLPRAVLPRQVVIGRRTPGHPRSLRRDAPPTHNPIESPPGVLDGYHDEPGSEFSAPCRARSGRQLELAIATECMSSGVLSHKAEGSTRAGLDTLSPRCFCAGKAARTWTA
jgi:hypothetical protein